LVVLLCALNEFTLFIKKKTKNKKNNHEDGRNTRTCSMTSSLESIIYHTGGIMRAQ